MEASDPREQMLARWDRAAEGWSRRADEVREHGMPVSVWMIEHLDLQPGERVLELAAGPGDTGFLAAELIEPGGVLVCSDASEAMLELARGRARERRLENVEFARLELEWIDLETASVDAVICRWALMLLPDPPAAMMEMRRVLKPGGRAAVAVWDLAERNPWATVDGRALIELGYANPPAPGAPGMFALAAPGRLAEMLGDAGFVDVLAEAVPIERSYPSIAAYVEEQLDLSRQLAEVYDGLDDRERAAFLERVSALAAPYTADDGSLSLPGSSLAAAAAA